MNVFPVGRRRPRVAAILAITLATFLAACGSSESDANSGSGPETKKLTVGVTPVGDFAPIYYAKEKGIFAEHGLDVTIDPKGASEVPPLVAGSYQAVSMSWTTFIQAAAQKVPLLGLYPGINGAADTQTGIYVMESSGIKSAADLEGKKLAINQPKATFELNSRVALDDAGADLSKIDFQVLPLPTIGDALVAGKVDAAYLVPPFSTIAESKGATLLVDAYDGQLDGSPIAGYVVTKKFADENPLTIAALRDSMTEAAEALNKDDAYRSFVPTFTKLTPELAEQAPAYTFPTSIDVPKLQALADLMATEKFSTRKIDISSLVVASDD